MKVVINSDIGGFGLSPRALKKLFDLKPELFGEGYYAPEFWAGPRASENMTETEIRQGFRAYLVIDDHRYTRLDGNCFSDWNSLIFYDKLEAFYLHLDDKQRSDPVLVQLVEEMDGTERQEGANGDHSILKIVEIPDGVDYIICAQDNGQEWIAEKHRTWS